MPQLLEYWGVGPFALTSLAALGAVALAVQVNLWWALLAVPVVAIVGLGINDVFQPRHSVLRNFPVLGHLRYLLESLRPELRQYFVESDQEENPFSREMRSIVYQRAKEVLDTQAFGTRHNVYASGYEWIAQSLVVQTPEPASARVVIGEGRCSQPYSSSILNVSAMSYGALSDRAILALNGGAQQGGFFHNTGEGGISPFHLKPGGDLVWQIGTGYFGCRSSNGDFDPERFSERARLPNVKMIEIKLSQGAKPGHGGLLPGDKVTQEIADIRGVPVGETVHSPPNHRAFEGPTGLLTFVTQLRELSGGKPVGFKLCVGQPEEILSIVKAMRESGLSPDFITIDGAEGGTGASPPEFCNSVGMPLADGLTFVHNALVGAGLREQVKLISAGKIATAFQLVQHLALGADLCNSGRSMLFAVGCIQALKCNTNHCPVGVATQDPRLTRGLVVDTKARRVYSFHKRTIDAALELVGSAGLRSPTELRPRHLYRRVSATKARTLEQLYSHVVSGSLLEGSAEPELQKMWDSAHTHDFASG